MQHKIIHSISYGIGDFHNVYYIAEATEKYPCQRCAKIHLKGEYVSFWSFRKNPFYMCLSCCEKSNVPEYKEGVRFWKRIKRLEHIKNSLNEKNEG